MYAPVLLGSLTSYSLHDASEHFDGDGCNEQKSSWGNCWFYMTPFVLGATTFGFPFSVLGRHRWAQITTSISYLDVAM